MNNITLSYVSRGLAGIVASHNTVVDMTGVTADDANVQALIIAQMKIKEQAYFSKMPAIATTENITFAVFVGRCMTKGAAGKALIDENAKLKAEYAALKEKYERATQK